jgi:ribonuclease HII
MGKEAKPSAKRMAHFEEILSHDRQFEAFGVSLAGMDEVGRGPLFGPVMAACVILPGEPLFPWMDDSKKLSAARREALYDQIMAHALFVGIGEASPREIDRWNILNATKLAMERAANKAPASLCLVDAVRGLNLSFPIQSIVHGDHTSYHIAAASIIAKVTRDQRMTEFAKEYPQYGLERNMGYGTAVHLKALRELGATPEHRTTFIQKFVKEATV